MKTNKLLDDDSIFRANASPHNIRSGITNPWQLIFGGGDVAEMMIGGNLFVFGPMLAPIVIDGVRLFAFAKSPDTGEWLLEINLYDWCNRPLLIVRDNELIMRSDSWDISIEGTTLTLREAPRKVLFRVRFEPPHRVVVERADIMYNGVHVAARKEKIWANGIAWTLGGNLLNLPIGILIGPDFPGSPSREYAALVEDVNRYRFDSPTSSQPQYDDPDEEV